MGFTPSQVDAMTCWEFAACCEGYRQSKGGAKPQSEISDEELRNMGIVGF